MAKKKTLLTLWGAASGILIYKVGSNYVRWIQVQDSDEDLLTVPEGQDRFVETKDGLKLFTKQCGNGAKTFVLSHCWTGDHRIWGPVAQVLVDKGYRVILYDQRGHGRSEYNEDALNVDYLGEDLMDVIGAYKLKDYYIAGHSMGGMAAQSLIARYYNDIKDQAKGFAFVSTLAKPPLESPQISHVASRIFASDRFNSLLSSEKIMHLMMRFSLGDNPTTAQIKAVSETFKSTPIEVRHRFLGSFSKINFLDSLNQVETPCLVLVGSKDMLTPMMASKAILSRLNNAELEVIPGAGHMLPIEVPRQIAELLIKAYG
jgi:non-heme chloroperoxidase